VIRPGKRSGGLGRTLVGLGVLLVGLLALVALSSSGDVASDLRGGGERAEVPPAVVSYLYAAFLIAAVCALPLLLYLYARERDESPAKRRRRWLLPLTIVGISGLLFAIASKWPDTFAEALDRISLGGNFDRPDVPGTEGGSPPAVEWAPVAVLGSLALSGVACFAAWRMVRRRGELARRESLAAVLSATLDGTLDDLRSDPDVRRAIIRAYACMEAALESCGVARQGSEAPLEYVARVLLELDVTPGPVHDLTDLFEQAKFSDHTLGVELKEAAIESLEAIRAELRALA
jgi:hypothetical protein